MPRTRVDHVVDPDTHLIPFSGATDAAVQAQGRQDDARRRFHLFCILGAAVRNSWIFPILRVTERSAGEENLILDFGSFLILTLP